MSVFLQEINNGLIKTEYKNLKFKVNYISNWIFIIY